MSAHELYIYTIWTSKVTQSNKKPPILSSHVLIIPFFLGFQKNRHLLLFTVTQNFPSTLPEECCRTNEVQHRVWPAYPGTSILRHREHKRSQNQWRNLKSSSKLDCDRASCNHLGSFPAPLARHPVGEHHHLEATQWVSQEIRRVKVSKVWVGPILVCQNALA